MQSELIKIIKMTEDKNKRLEILEQAEDLIQDCEDQIKELEDIINNSDTNENNHIKNK